MLFPFAGGMQPVGIVFLTLFIVAIVGVGGFFGVKYIMKRKTLHDQGSYERMLDNNISYNSASDTPITFDTPFNTAK